MPRVPVSKEGRGLASQLPARALSADPDVEGRHGPPKDLPGRRRKHSHPGIRNAGSGLELVLSRHRGTRNRGESLVEIARSYAVSHSTISRLAEVIC